MSDIFEKWGDTRDIVVGDKKADKPSIISFNDSDKALRILNKHIKYNSKIAVHGDVDLDGMGTTYILKKFLVSQSSRDHLFIVNKEKIHGIMEKHVNYFNETYPVDLVIILDSSCNEIELIKKFKCDVIVIDHHEMLHEDTYGVKNVGGKETEYVIVNNMLDNSDIKGVNELIKKEGKSTIELVEEYKADSRMSCGLVLYELLRLYSEAYGAGPVLENLMLYQWVGITLFTDAIQLNTERNQWYIENTVGSMAVEPNLNIIMQELNKFKAKLDKTFINYTFAPTINRAIRASASGEAMNIILNQPSRIKELGIYREQQDNAVKSCVEDVKYTEEFICKDITEMDIHSNYFGVIAGRLCGNNKLNTVVYKVKDGIAQGSFRGRFSEVDYRGMFECYREGVYAQGHKAAFGFKVLESELREIMGTLKDIEPVALNEHLVTAGSMCETLGKHRIKCMDEFKKQGNLWRLAIGNSKVSSYEDISITVDISDVTLKEARGKIYVYEVLGLECKAFEVIKTSAVEVYVEYSNNIEIYLRNKGEN